MLVLLSLSCSPAVHVPLPKVTEYDHDAKLRAAYIESFERGYRLRWKTGHYIIRDGPGLTTKLPEGEVRAELARTRGFEDGQSAGAKASMAYALEREKTESRRR